MKIKLILILNIFALLTALGQQKNNPDFPDGLVLTTSHCSDQCCPKEEELYLFEDGNCVFRQIVNQWSFDRLTYFGTWQLRDTLIIIHYQKHFGGQGIGDGSTDLEYGCSGIGYKSYNAFAKQTDSWDTVDWKNFKNNVTSSLRPIAADNTKKPSSYRAKFEEFNFLQTKVTTENKIYSKQYLGRLTKPELKKIRNEIFAKYGYIFSGNDLTDYFKSQPWYSPKYKNVDAFLSKQDKTNIELIKFYENK